MWEQPEAIGHLARTYALIINCSRRRCRSNHHNDSFNGEDFQMFEKDLPATPMVQTRSKSVRPTLETAEPRIKLLGI